MTRTPWTSHQTRTPARSMASGPWDLLISPLDKGPCHLTALIFPLQLHSAHPTSLLFLEPALNSSPPLVTLFLLNLQWLPSTYVLENQLSRLFQAHHLPSPRTHPRTPHAPSKQDNSASSQLEGHYPRGLQQGFHPPTCHDVLLPAPGMLSTQGSPFIVTCSRAQTSKQRMIMMVANICIVLAKRLAPIIPISWVRILRHREVK